jgi:hypothetical protein
MGKYFLIIGKLLSFVQVTREGVKEDSLITTEGSHFYQFYAGYIKASLLVD